MPPFRGLLPRQAVDLTLYWVWGVSRMPPYNSEIVRIRSSLNKTCTTWKTTNLYNGHNPARKTLFHQMTWHWNNSYADNVLRMWS
jgi:hypothetical protein